MEVQVEGTRTDQASSFVVDIPGCHVPFQCSGGPGSCTSVKVGDGYFIVPANSSLIAFNASERYTVETHPDMADCNPTNLFFDKRQTLHVACTRVSGGSTGVKFLWYHLSGLKQGTVTFEHYLTTESVTGQNVSLSIFVRNASCIISSDVLVLVDNNMWTFSTGVPSKGPKLENCSQLERLDYPGGDIVTAYCEGGVTATYNACSGRWSYHYPNEMGRYYSCGAKRGTVLFSGCDKCGECGGDGGGKPKPLRGEHRLRVVQ